MLIQWFGMEMIDQNLGGTTPLDVIINAPKAVLEKQQQAMDTMFDLEEDKLSIVELENHNVKFTAPNNSKIKSVAIYERETCLCKKKHNCFYFAKKYL